MKLQSKYNKFPQIGWKGCCVQKKIQCNTKNNKGKVKNMTKIQWTK